MLTLCIYNNLSQFRSSTLPRSILLKYSLGVRLLSSSNDDQRIKAQVEKPKLHFTDSERSRRIIGPFGWILLLVPVLTFCLGTWQVRRKAWKEQLIAEMRRRRDAQPAPLPDSMDLSMMEYYPIHVRGHFLHNLEMFLGPRTLLIRGDAATESGLMSQSSGSGARQGYLLVTPFQLEGRQERILVNRGWVPASYLKVKGRRHTEDKERTVTTDVIGLLRLAERRPPFMPQQQSRGDNSVWMYRNIEQMAVQAGEQCTHVYLDATDDHLPFPRAAQARADVAVAPIANQTRVTLRNEHLSYVMTWYGLSAATAILWYRHFLIKR